MKILLMNKAELESNSVNDIKFIDSKKKIIIYLLYFLVNIIY